MSPFHYRALRDPCVRSENGLEPWRVVRWIDSAFDFGGCAGVIARFRTAEEAQVCADQLNRITGRKPITNAPSNAPSISRSITQ